MKAILGRVILRCGIAALALGCTVAAAADLRLNDMRLWDAPEHTRVVFDLQASDAAGLQHEIIELENPRRVVVDIARTDASGVQVARKVAGKGAVTRVRSAPREDGALRVVLDLAQAAQVRSYVLEPGEEYGHRLVVELTPAANRPDAVAAAPAEAEKAAEAIVIAVDAGHGGEDPGARGRTGLLEKDVALSIARRLATLINQQKGYRAVLTRDGDYYIGLRERVAKAREVEADLFVSVHANAFKDRNLRGSAVYVLSDRAATNEHARWLARKENAADFVGGMQIASKDHDLAAVLLDLSQSSTMDASFDLGSRILGSLSRINRLQKAEVQQAGFMVLKAPDIPSVLVETAFITNKEEERLLGDGQYQERMARSILEGVLDYFETYRPASRRQLATAQPVGYQPLPAQEPLPAH